MNTGADFVSIFAIVPILMMIGVIVSYIILLIAVWKLMRAHESVANSLTWIAQTMQEKGKRPDQPDAGQ